MSFFVYKMSGIPVPAPLKLGLNDEDAFKVFKLQWNYYSVATNVATKPASQQVAMLMSIMGADGVMLVEELNLTAAEKDSTSTILQKMEAQLVPKRDKRVERAEFQTMSQREAEGIDDYVKRLKKKAQGCSYAADELEEHIKDRIIAGIRDNLVRRELLKAGDLSLKDMVKKIKDHQQIEELAQQYEKMTSYKEEPSVCTADALKVTATKKISQCIYCGGRHAADKNQCPAWGKKCLKCGRLNHFRKVCRSKTSNKFRRRNIRRVDGRSTDSDDCETEEECEYVDIAKVDSDGKHGAGKIMVQLKVLDGALSKLFDVQVDTGARVNVICDNDLKRLVPKHDLQATNVRLRCYSGKIITPKGKVKLDIQLKHGSKQLTFVVVNKTRPPLLSAQSAIDLGIIKVHDIYTIDDLQEDCTQTMRKFKDVFIGDGKFHGKFRIEIDKSIAAVQQKPRRIPLAYLPELKEKISELEEKGIVEPVDRHMEWLSNLVLVKKGEKLRICLDPSELNQAIKRVNHQIPTIEEMLPDFTKAKVFTVLDAKNGFWHLQLDEESSDLTAFWTPMGVYRWKRMPFGVSCAPEIFQKAQQQVVSGLKGVRCLADDIIVFGCGETVEEAMVDHNQNLRNVLQRCRERGLKLNRSKVKIALSSVPFFGHVLTDQGVMPDPNKVSAIAEIQTPKNKKELMTFLGLSTYLAKFLPRLAALASLG